MIDHPFHVQPLKMLVEPLVYAPNLVYVLLDVRAFTAAVDLPLLPH